MNYNDLVTKCRGRYEIRDYGRSMDKVNRYKIVNRKTYQTSIGSIDYLCKIVDKENKERDDKR